MKDYKDSYTYYIEIKTSLKISVGNRKCLRKILKEFPERENIVSEIKNSMDKFNSRL